MLSVVGALPTRTVLLRTCMANTGKPRVNIWSIMRAAHFGCRGSSGFWLGQIDAYWMIGTSVGLTVPRERP